MTDGVPHDGPAMGAGESLSVGSAMRDVDHTHPFDDRSAGDLFLRGPTVVTDGGHDPGPPVEDSDPAEDRTVKPTMRDVDHVPPHGEGANRVLERGSEHGSEPIVGSEFDDEASEEDDPATTDDSAAGNDPETTDNPETTDDPATTADPAGTEKSTATDRREHRADDR